MNHCHLVLLICAFAATGTICAQAPAPDTQQELVTLIKQVQNQQAQLAANQDKIDEKLATLAESIRQARIYSSRGGK